MKAAGRKLRCDEVWFPRWSTSGPWCDLGELVEPECPVDDALRGVVQTELVPPDISA
jgi:hypothetical protein